MIRRLGSALRNGVDAPWYDAYASTAALFLSTFANSMFSIVILKVCTLTPFTPVFMLVLFLAVVPLGGVVWANVQTISIRQIRTCQMVNIAAIALALGAMTFILKLPLPKEMGESLGRVLFYTALVVLLFSPFFFAWGLNEFALFFRMAYATRAKVGFYTVFLVAIGLSYFSEHVYLWRFGVLSKSVFAVTAIALALAILSKKARLAVALVPALLVVGVWVDRFEGDFINSIRGDSEQLSLKSHLDHSGMVDRSLADGHTNGLVPLPTWRRTDNKILAAFWDKYCYFTLFQTSWYTAGVYGDLVTWANPVTGDFSSFPQQKLMETAAFRFVKNGARMAIIGAGGGAQVATGLARDPATIAAVEIVGGVIDSLTKIAPDANKRIYLDPRVQTYAMDGRTFLEESGDQYDLIYLPHAEMGTNLMRTYFEPSQRLYTVEAFELMRKRLAPGGVIVIRKGNYVAYGAHFRSMFMSMEKAGLEVVGYQTPKWFLLIGSVGHKPPPDPELDAAAKAEGYDKYESPHRFGTVDPITDDRPFDAGVIFAYYPKSEIRRMERNAVGIVLGLVAVLGLADVIRRRSVAKSARRIGVAAASILIGMNFLALEYMVIYRIIGEIQNSFDSFYLGSVVFLLAAASGGYIAKRGWTGATVIVSLAVGALGMWYFQNSVVQLLTTMPMIACTGTFFPRLFGSRKADTVVVYVFDALGGALGAIVAFSEPVVRGFHFYYLETLAIFVVTAVFVLIQTRNANE